MNILQHIEAGHYPRDERRRAIVPYTSGGFVTVYAINGEGEQPIIGRHSDGALGAWQADSDQLRPPPPRKVPVKVYAVMVKGQPKPWVVKETETDAFIYARERLSGSGWTVIPLIGEIEEPWS